MDSAFRIPGTQFRIGLDGIIGLIPGVGDFFGLVVSFYFIFVATRMGLPNPIVGRMLVNVAIDSAVGAIPVLGDLFDFGWKSNRKNLALVERCLSDPQSTRSQSLLFLGTLVFGILTALALIIYGLVQLLSMIFGLVF